MFKVTPQHFHPETFLGTEVVVERTFGHTGTAEDFGQAYGRKTLAQDDGLTGGKQVFAGIGKLAGT